MLLTFLGSGSAFTLNNWHSNMMITNKDINKRLFIDCGADFRHSLKEIGLTYQDVTDVYISHLHNDHIGGLEYLALTTYFTPDCPKPRLYIHRSLKNKLWNSLAGGLETLQGQEADLDTYFDIIHPSKKGNFIWEDTFIQTVQTVHVMNAFTIVPSFGLLMKGDSNSIFITTDSQFCPEQIKDFYVKSDIIFQDCETLPFKSGVHAHYEDLKTLPYDIKLKMWLYHYQDNYRQVFNDETIDTFGGVVEKRQEFYF